MDPNDFARLFYLDGIGQVLVTKETHEDSELPTLCYRIASTATMGISLTITPSYRAGTSIEEMEDHQHRILARLTEHSVREIVKDMVDLRAAMTDALA